MIEWMNESMNEWLNEWMNQWMNQWMNEWMNERTDDSPEWLHEIPWNDMKWHEMKGHTMNEWMNEWTNERTNGPKKRGPCICTDWTSINICVSLLFKTAMALFPFHCSSRGDADSSPRHCNWWHGRRCILIECPGCLNQSFHPNRIRVLSWQKPGNLICIVILIRGLGHCGHTGITMTNKTDSQLSKEVSKSNSRLMDTAATVLGRAKEARGSKRK